MKKKEIENELGDFEYWRKASNLERIKFARSMRGLQYGRDALEIALAFWIHGYRTGTNDNT